MKTLLRSAAVAVASVALVAGTTSAVSAAPGDTTTVRVTLKTAVHSGFGSTDSTYVPSTTSISAPDSSSVYGIKATVNVNGKPVANAVSIYSTGFYFKRSWGAGVVSLTNFTASGRDIRAGQPNYGYYTDQRVNGSSNSVRVRYGLEYRSGLQIRKKGKKLTFKIKARYVGANGKNVGVRKATLQVKKGKKWKTLKKVKLKKSGNGTYKRSDKKKRKYRLVIKTTPTVKGAKTRSIKI